MLAEEEEEEEEKEEEEKEEEEKEKKEGEEVEGNNIFSPLFTFFLGISWSHFLLRTCRKKTRCGNREKGGSLSKFTIILLL